MRIVGVVSPLAEDRGMILHVVVLCVCPLLGGNPLDPTRLLTALHVVVLWCVVCVPFALCVYAAQSEAIRLAKTSRILGVALNPLDETSMALVTSDGRVLFYRVSGASFFLRRLNVVQKNDCPC